MALKESVSLSLSLSLSLSRREEEDFKEEDFKEEEGFHYSYYCWAAVFVVARRLKEKN